MLKVEGVGYNVQGHQEVHRGVVGTKVKNVIYIYIYINFYLKKN
jgi:hypothetical protein